MFELDGGEVDVEEPDGETDEALVEHALDVERVGVGALDTELGEELGCEGLVVELRGSCGRPRCQGRAGSQRCGEWGAH